MTLRRSSITIFAAVLLLASCATKPPAAPEPVIEAPVQVEPQAAVEPVVVVPEIAREELDALLARVVALRKDAFEHGLKDVMPAEYSAADTKYLAGKSAMDADDRPNAKAELQSAESLFTELLAKGLPVVAENRKGFAAAARERAIAANAEAFSPEALATADAILAEADKSSAAGDARSAIAAYADAIRAFDATEKRSLAVVVKARVDEFGFSAADSGNYALAEEKLSSVDSLIASDTPVAQDAADEALLRYRLVLAKGWELMAGGKRVDAEKYKTDSDDIKAAVAVKDKYSEAKSVLDMADAATLAGDNEAAVPLFDQAGTMFKEVYDIAASKRAAAEAAIMAANAKNAESASIAQEGDATLGDTGIPATDGTKE